MRQHKPGKHQSCADADRAADEQIEMLRAEIARMTAYIATLTRPLPALGENDGYWWTAPSTTDRFIITYGNVS